MTSSRYRLLCNSTHHILASDVAGTSAALLLKRPTSYQDAESACSSLGEQLWCSSDQSFHAGLNSSLWYEVYAGRVASEQLFWTADDSGHAWRHGRAHCLAMYPSGETNRVHCNTLLPALCTQTAPGSNATFADTSQTYQIVQSTGSQSLIGYRDFFTFHFSGVRFALEPKR